MTKGYSSSILQKKLQELESDILQVFDLPAHTPSYQLLSSGIDQRLEFLNNLLSAESASLPSKPRRLRHIAHRLTQLKTHWDDHTTSVLSRFDAAADSTGSCTESCLNDDGDLGSPELGSTVYEEDCYPETFLEPVVEEKAPVESVRVESLEITATANREDGRVWGWKYCGAMGGGVVFGAVLMGFVMVRFFCCFHCYMEHGGSLIPT